MVGSLGREDPLEAGMATHSSILAGESHGQRSLQATVHGVEKSNTTERLKQQPVWKLFYVLIFEN